jgi:hypothetical protein
MGQFDIETSLESLAGNGGAMGGARSCWYGFLITSRMIRVGAVAERIQAKNIPASYKARMISGAELAGPRVATIFALR